MKTDIMLVHIKHSYGHTILTHTPIDGINIEHNLTHTRTPHIESRLFSYAVNREILPQCSHTVRRVCVRKVYAIILQFIAIEFEYVKTKPSKAKNIIRFQQLGKMCREAMPMYTARTSYRCGRLH